MMIQFNIEVVFEVNCYLFLLFLILLVFLYLYKHLFSHMRDSHSVDRNLARGSQNFITTYYPYREVPKLRIQNKSDTQLLQHFYYPSMSQIYRRNDQNHPNPARILQNFKALQKKAENLQKIVQQYQQKMRDSQKSSKLQIRTDQTLSALQQTKSQKYIKKTLNQEYAKAKVKLLPILQQYLKDSKHYIKLSSNQIDSFPDTLYQCVSAIVKKLKLEVVNADHNAFDRLNRRYQANELKTNRELSEQTNINKRLMERQEQFKIQINILNTQLEKVSNEKTNLHGQLVKAHKTLNEEGLVIAQLRKHLKEQRDRVFNLQSSLEKNGKIISNNESAIKQLELAKSDIESKNIEIAEQNDKLYKQIEVLKKKMSEEMTRNNMWRSSQEAITSLKVIGGENEDKSRLENANLRARIQSLEGLLRTKNQELESERISFQMRLRQDVQKIVNQWREYLQKIVEQQQKQQAQKECLLQKLREEKKRVQKQLKQLKQSKNK